MRPLWIGLAFVSILSSAVVDRVAIVVGKTVITETELLDEVRITEFLNRQPLNLSAEARREAAQRLVDQQLLRNEMDIARYPAPTPAEADGMLRKFRQEHYTSLSQFRTALQRFGLTEDQVKQHLLWQLAVIRFTDARFRPLANASAGPTDGADRSTPETPAAAPPVSVDQLLENWLKDQRANTRVILRPEALQ